MTQYGLVLRKDYETFSNEEIDLKRIRACRDFLAKIQDDESMKLSSAEYGSIAYVTSLLSAILSMESS